ncbi:MAG: transglutaminase-like domain-containing protein, partial [Candidatus Binatia bacterium]
MCRVVHLFALLCFVVVLCGAQSVNAQDEEQIFGHEEAVVSRVSPALIPAPQHPATAYWKVSATMDLRFASPGTHVQMLLPLSDERQSVLERRTSAEGVSYREEADGLNLWGHWLVTKTPTVPQQITYDYTVQITDSAQSLPSVLFPLRNIPVSARIYVQPSGVIQSDAPEVRQQAVALTRTSRSVERAIRTLFEYTVALVSLDSGSAKNDALTVITEQRASRMGKTRALVALLRAVGIPARIVGGIRLGDTAVKRTTIAWVEAFVDHSWIPMDPAGGYFAWLPNTYLALYRDDLPLLTHSRKVPVEYSFFIRQVSRNVVLPERANGGRRRDRERLGIRHEAEHGHTIATYVDNPRASVVLINDGPIPRGTVDRILADARQVQLNVAVLSADFESSYSRERYLQSLVSNNLTLIREADLLLISTADTAAMYALLKQGELGVRLD